MAGGRAIARFSGRRLVGGQFRRDRFPLLTHQRVNYFNFLIRAVLYMERYPLMG